MKCPKCGKKLAATHLSSAGKIGETHRVQCVNPKCALVVTTVTFMAAIDPPYGQGAASLAGKIKQSGKIPRPLFGEVDTIPLEAQKSRHPRQ